MASESESVRNGLLSNYARLTEDNIELQRAIEEATLEKEKMRREFEMHQQEITRMENRSNQLTRQLQQKDLDAAESKRKLEDLDGRLAAGQDELRSADGDRRRLREELSETRRGSTDASRQLIRLRNRFSSPRGDADPGRRPGGSGATAPRAGSRSRGGEAAREPTRRTWSKMRVDGTRTNGGPNHSLDYSRDSIGPRSGTGATNGVSLDGMMDSVMNGHSANGNASAAGRATSQRRISRENSATDDMSSDGADSVTNDHLSHVDWSATSRRRISRGTDGRMMDSLMDGHFGNDAASSVGRATSRPIIPRAKSATDGISFTAVGNDTNDRLGTNNTSFVGRAPPSAS